MSYTFNDYQNGKLSGVKHADFIKKIIDAKVDWIMILLDLNLNTNPPEDEVCDVIQNIDDFDEAMCEMVVVELKKLGFNASHSWINDSQYAIEVHLT